MPVNITDKGCVFRFLTRQKNKSHFRDSLIDFMIYLFGSQQLECHPHQILVSSPFHQSFFSPCTLTQDIPMWSRTSLGVKGIFGHSWRPARAPVMYQGLHHQESEWALGASWWQMLSEGSLRTWGTAFLSLSPAAFSLNQISFLRKTQLIVMMLNGIWFQIHLGKLCKFWNVRESRKVGRMSGIPGGAGRLMLGSWCHGE